MSAWVQKTEALRSIENSLRFVFALNDVN